ncbi:MAG TPA: ABC transporter permease [Acidobacteriota bacterium]|nr:ABC transporter permease [Acidobacteriota bacterium]
MREVIAIAVKDLRLMLRDKAGFFFIFFFPLLIAIFFGTLFVNEGSTANRLKVFVIDEDQTSASQAFVDRLKAAPELEVHPASRQEAVDRVRRGGGTAYIAVLAGFAEGNIFGDNPPAVELGVDPTRRAEEGLLEGVLMKYASERLSELFTDPAKATASLEQWRQEVLKQPELSAAERQKVAGFLEDLSNVISRMPPAEDDGQPQGRFEPLRIEKADVQVHWEGPPSSYAVTFPQGVMWGILGCAAAFGISLVIERTRGTLVRLRMAPLGRGHILAGKALACFITMVTLSVTLLVFARLVFGVRPGSLSKLAFALGAVAVCFVGIMMLLSVLGRTEQAAGGIGWAVVVVMAMLGGGMLPLFFMPKWLQAISHFSPVKWGILAMEGAMWRGFSYTEMLLPCAILLAIGTVCFAVGERAFKWLE